MNVHVLVRLGFDCFCSLFFCYKKVTICKSAKVKLNGCFLLTYGLLGLQCFCNEARPQTRAHNYFGCAINFKDFSYGKEKN